MNIRDVQDQIDKTEYWDVNILDFQILYFGDEAVLYIYYDEKSCWKVRFTSCYKIKYETDANTRKILNVKSMKIPQLGYFGQDITVMPSGMKDFYKIVLDLSILNAEIICRGISVQKVSNSSVRFFWND